MQLTRDKWMTIITIGAVNVIAGAASSLMGPFYPAEAEKKGASATEYGLVFGAFDLFNFIISPIIGEIVEKYGIRIFLVGGMTIRSIAIIVFGLLDNVGDKFLFIGLSIILRIIESLGSSCVIISGFSLIGTAFPNDLATMFAILEIFFGVGWILGPTVGGFLFKVGGFPFPFVAVGVMGIITAIIIIFLLPRGTNLPQKNEKYNSKTVLKVPVIALCAVCQIMFTISLGFYSALLEPHLRQFNLPPETSSLFFTIDGTVYAVVSPFLGVLVDKYMQPRTLITLGCICVIGSFTIVGPAPFLPFQATIPMCIIALVIQGIAFGAAYVGTFTEMFRSARAAGFPDTIGTYGLVAGIWMSAVSLGAFVGPVISGILYDQLGFRWATQFISGSFVILLIAVIILHTRLKPPTNRTAPDKKEIEYSAVQLT